MICNFLTIEEVLAIHHHQIQEFGGEPGLLNFGALESALMRPQIGYYSSIIEQASAMMESLAMNHPFVDGNKRVAFFATDTFLRLNGYHIDCDSLEAHQHLMALFDANAFRFDNLAIWLAENVRPLSV